MFFALFPGFQLFEVDGVRAVAGHMGNLLIVLAFCNPFVNETEQCMICMIYIYTHIYICTFVCCIYNMFIFTDVHNSHTQIYSCFCVTSSVVPSAIVKISLRKSSVHIFSKLVSSLVTPCCYQYCNQAVLLGLLVCLLSAPMLEREILVCSGEQLRTKLPHRTQQLY